MSALPGRATRWNPRRGGCWETGLSLGATAARMRWPRLFSRVAEERGVSTGAGACLGCPHPPAPSPASGRGGDLNRASDGSRTRLRVPSLSAPRRWAVVVAEDSFARAGFGRVAYGVLHPTPFAEPRLGDPCRCRAQACSGPRQDPSARVGRRTGEGGALGPLDDRRRLMRPQTSSALGFWMTDPGVPRGEARQARTSVGPLPAPTRGHRM